MLIKQKPCVIHAVLSWCLMLALVGGVLWGFFFFCTESWDRTITVI
jgi:hypothetical protein